MTFLKKLFSYDLIIKSYEDRLKDKEKEISRLVEEAKDLRDRLFLKNSLPIVGQELTTSKGNSVEGWVSPKKRVSNLINSQIPSTPLLSESEKEHLRAVAQ